jgi:hypothetical protein
MLILFGDGALASPADTRQGVAALYPRAMTIVFERGERAIALSDQEKYFRTIDDSLAS